MMTARVPMLLNSHASLSCFRACFLPGLAKDLSAPQVKHYSGDDGRIFTADDVFGNSLSNFGTPSAVTIYSSYVWPFLLNSPDLKFWKP